MKMLLQEHFQLCKIPIEKVMYGANGLAYFIRNLKSMKKLMGISVLSLMLAFFADQTPAYSQGKGKGNGKNEVKKGGGPPPWAPAHGYRAKTRYVYFKDHDVYYDHTRGVYISISNGKWVVSAKIPTKLSGIDLAIAAKIDLDFDGDEPQRDHANHKKKYPPAKR